MTTNISSTTLRSALLNNGQDGDDFLQGAAADYALAIDEANERLRHCGASNSRRTRLQTAFRREKVAVTVWDEKIGKILVAGKNVVTRLGATKPV